MARANIVGTCHCGTIQFEVPRKPAVLTRCNCSYCRRIDPLFAYYKRRTVSFSSDEAGLARYAWGRGALQWFRCMRCGSFTHHAPAGHDGPEARIGINMRLVRPDLLRGATVKLRDGAQGTWRVLRVHVL